jgi:membrane protein YdbS with pleckstrin-like domain
MPYPTKMLNDDETVAVDLHPHWWYFAEPVATLVGALILAILAISFTDGDTQKWLSLIALGLIIFSAAWLVIRYGKWGTTNFVVTNDRVIFRTGIIAKSGIEIPLERVNNVNSSQSVFERLVGAGDLMIESGGEDGQQRFTDIRRPDRVKNIIHQQINVNERNVFRDVGLGGPSTAGGTDLATQLEKLEGMRDRGTLTPEEFESQKRRLLGG